jgi:hypothetical protein
MVSKERAFGRSMLEYSKMILSKMSFDRKLFRKEYRKAFRYPDGQEQAELKNWLRSETKSVSEPS